METREKERRARINFRPLFFCALSVAFGVFLYGKIAFGGLKPSDFLFFGLFFAFALFPLSKKRTLALILVCAAGISLGMGAHRLYDRNYSDVKEAGNYVLSGVVVSVARREGYSSVTLSSLRLDGEKTGGKCRLTVSSNVYPGQKIISSARVKPADREAYGKSDYASNVRYVANAEACTVEGNSLNPFLRLNAALMKTLERNMGGEEAGIAYALLTGNSACMDLGFLKLAREGGIAHIFAVSGLHIGILFAAVCLLFRPLGRYRVLPAMAAAFLYSAMCNFTPSSLRAAIMCASAAAVRLSGGKPDFLEGISLAALCVLLISPAEWYSAGFRLSFGACLGLSLFSGSFSRAFARLPKFAADYLSAALSVQIFLFPIQMDCFGYISVWGILLNFLIIPLLPALFLGLLAACVGALILPPAAAVFLALPKGAISGLGLLFSLTDFSFTLHGFQLGAGFSAFLLGFLFLGEKFRMKGKTRAAVGAALCLFFVAAVTAENAVFLGCKIETESDGEKTMALVCVREERVLVLDGDCTLEDAERFLLRRVFGQLSAIVVLCEDEVSGINTAVHLPAEKIYARDFAETGLSRQICFAESFSVGTLEFTFEARDKLMLTAEGITVEFDYGGRPSIGGDLFLGEGGSDLKYFLKDGIISS